jgi:hypothetical protein
MTPIHVFSRIRPTDELGLIQVQGTSPIFGLTPILNVYLARRGPDSKLRISLGPDYLDFVLAFGTNVDLLKDMHELAVSYDDSKGWVN